MGFPNVNENVRLFLLRHDQFVYVYRRPLVSTAHNFLVMDLQVLPQPCRHTLKVLLRTSLLFCTTHLKLTLVLHLHVPFRVDMVLQLMQQLSTSPTHPHQSFLPICPLSDYSTHINWFEWQCMCKRTVQKDSFYTQVQNEPNQSLPGMPW